MALRKPAEPIQRAPEKEHPLVPRHQGIQADSGSEQLVARREVCQGGDETLFGVEWGLIAENATGFVD